MLQETLHLKDLLTPELNCIPRANYVSNSFMNGVRATDTEIQISYKLNEENSWKEVAKREIGTAPNRQSQTRIDNYWLNKLVRISNSFDEVLKKYTLR